MFSAVLRASSIISLAFSSALPIVLSALFFRREVVTLDVISTAAITATTRMIAEATNTITILVSTTGAPPYEIFIVHFAPIIQIIVHNRMQFMYILTSNSQQY